MEQRRDLAADLDELVARCRRQQRWLGCAESMTGGSLSAAIVTRPDSGTVFCGGLVSYASHVKRSLLGVTAEQVVSADAAEEMALGVMQLFGCDVGIAVTGVAGPARQDGQEVGTVFVSVAQAGRGAVCRRLALGGDPEEIRELAVRHAIAYALEVL